MLLLFIYENTFRKQVKLGVNKKVNFIRVSVNLTSLLYLFEYIFFCLLLRSGYNGKLRVIYDDLNRPTTS